MQIGKVLNRKFFYIKSLLALSHKFKTSKSPTSPCPLSKNIWRTTGNRTASMDTRDIAGCYFRAELTYTTWWMLLLHSYYWFLLFVLIKTVSPSSVAVFYYCFLLLYLQHFRCVIGSSQCHPKKSCIFIYPLTSE